ncbi:NUDIX domain-containing protein [Anaerobacillus alkaliphilus]|uniref:NUDIX domain-containing protein n=1 Tax=Anaerobacillus alkaliphilus TaxID=1548597 RepID=A0A4Q0VZ15_9BACI|nr:NUDIX domain-containing protein [Anaerobacillus alkaliphilus]RXJ04308.1 NUDIX domain-containing protein [Anaerobacillus alkaliphilus]
MIVVGIGAVILNEKNEVLLVLRKKAPEANKWSIPGGKVEFLERLEDTVIREIKEEVNLDIEISKLLCTAETIDLSSSEHYLSLIYTTKNIKGTMKNMEPDKISEVQWFQLEEIPTELACFSVEALALTKQKYIVNR